jgi:hypothetical protein
LNVRRDRASRERGGADRCWRAPQLFSHESPARNISVLQEPLEKRVHASKEIEPALV